MNNRTGRLVTSLALLIVGCQSSAPKVAPSTPKPRAEQISRDQPDPRYEKFPEPLSVSPWVPPQPSVFKLKTGQNVWRLEQGPSPLFAFHIVLPSGAASDPRDKIGLTQLTADLFDEGAGGKTALELSDAFALLATDYSVSVQQDTTLISISGLAENLDESLRLLALIVKSPTLSQVEFERRRDHWIATALSRQAEPITRMREELSRAVFGGGYSGPHAGGTVESLRHIRLSDVRAHARGMLAGAQAEFVFVGPTGNEDLRPLLERHFANFTGKSSLKEVELTAESAPTEVVVIPFHDAAQSTLGLGKRTLGANSPDYFRELVMNEKFGGAFMSRVNLVLREEKGYTYGVDSGFQRARRAGMFTIMANVHAEATGASVDEILKQLGRLCTEPFTELEYQEAMGGLLLGYPLRFETASATAAQLATLPMYQREPDFLNQWPRLLKDVTLEQTRAAAQPYCDSRAFHVVIAGDETKIVPQLEQLGLRTTVLTQPEPTESTSMGAKTPIKPSAAKADRTP